MTDFPVLNIVGDKVALGPRRRDLMEMYVKWINDFDVVRSLALGMVPTTLEAEEAWYHASSVAGRDVHFDIYERSSLRPIGNTSLRNVDHFHRSAEFGIMIGEKDCRGKGYGTEATRLMLEYGFTALGLHNIMLTAYRFNEQGIGAYTSAGFRLIGHRREARRLAGMAYDVIYMDSLASEFQGSALRSLLPDASNPS